VFAERNGGNAKKEYLNVNYNKMIFFVYLKGIFSHLFNSFGLIFHSLLYFLRKLIVRRELFNSTDAAKAVPMEDGRAVVAYRHPVAERVEALQSDFKI
jgi:hypothetical protein